MAFCLKYSVLTLYHPGNIFFETMLINSFGLLVRNILDPLAYIGKWCFPLTSLRILGHVATQ
jgi:hypothetical protein